MSKRAITEESYQAMLEAFRKEPNPTKAARVANVDVRTMTKCWEQGWSNKGMEPASVVMEREQARARALIERDRQLAIDKIAKERADAEAQSVKARTQEGQMVELTRGAALQAVANIATMSSACKELAKIVSDRVKEYVALQKGDPDYLTPTKGLLLLQRCVSLHLQIEHIAKGAMEMERLHLGEPTHQINVVYKPPADMTRKELLIRVNSAVEAITQDVGAWCEPGDAPRLLEPVVGQRIDARNI